MRYSGTKNKSLEVYVILFFIRMRKQQQVQNVFLLFATAVNTACCVSLVYALQVTSCAATFIPPAARTKVSKTMIHPPFKKGRIDHWSTKSPSMGYPMKFHLSTQLSSSDDNSNQETIENRNCNNANNNQRLIGILVLLTVPLSWGTYAPVVKYVYEMNPPTPGFVFSAGYYLIASFTLVTLSFIQSLGNKVGNEAITRDFLSENIPRSGEIMRNANDILPDSRLQLLEKTLGGMELGSYLFIGNCLQVVGLESIPADRAAFLVQLTTVMVPILQATFARDFSFIPSTTWVACILAFAGVIIMGFDDGPGGLDIGEELFHRMGGDVVTHGFLFSGGDTFIILAALCYSMHVIRLGKYAKLTNPLELAASKATVEAILSVALVLGLLAIPSWTGDSIQLLPLVENESRDIQMYFSQLQYTISEGTFPPDGFLKAIAASLWTGLVTCAYTIYAQSFGQRRVDPTDANLIYTMQPIFSALFAWALLGESLGVFGYTGASLIGVALWIVTSNKGRG